MRKKEGKFSETVQKCASAGSDYFHDCAAISSVLRNNWKTFSRMIRTRLLTINSKGCNLK